jgi:hypothetical protein
VPDKGAYAVDFSAAPPALGFIDLGGTIESMAGLTEFTIEAWVKSTVDSPNLNGGIFSRSTGSDGGADYAGISLYIVNNAPTFKMSGGGDVTATTALTNGSWTHIAVVLANANHTLVHSACGGAEAGTPHLDIYIGDINGTTFNNCASASYPQAFEYGERIGRLHSQLDSMGESDTRLDAVIDEVRFWKVARTASQIQTWMNKEITETNWNQANPNDALIGYWSFNEGAGTSTSDASGTGNGGTKYYCQPGSGCHIGGTSILWEGGWTTGKLF